MLLDPLFFQLLLYEFTAEVKTRAMLPILNLHNFLLVLDV